MLRTLLVGILALSAVPSCGSKEAAPAATPGAPAGKVLELTGTVTATRGTEVRTLTQGGEISADDVIDTAAESRVVILLAHNNARWDLGSGRKVKVGESLAWTAAKQTGPVAVVKEETSTAGRYAEKTAATTTTTTAAMAESSPAPGGTAPAGTEGAKPAANEKETMAAATATPDAKVAPRKNADRKVADPALDRPTKNATQQPKIGGRAPGSTMPKDPIVQPAPPPPTDPGKRDTRDKGTTTEASRKPDVLNDEEDDGPDLMPKGGEGSGTRQGGDASIGVRVTSPLELEIRNTLTKQNAKLKACLGTSLTRLVLTVTVKDGTYTIQTSDAKATPEAHACLAKVAKTLKATNKGKASVPHAIFTK